MSSYFAVLGVVSGLHYAVAVSMFAYRHRQAGAFPVRGHSLGLILMVSTSIAAWAVFLAFELVVDQVPCQLIVFFAFPAIALWACTTMARAWRAWFLYSFGTEKLTSMRRLSRHRHHFTTRRLVTYALSGALSMIVVWAIPFFVFIDEKALETDSSLNSADTCGEGFNISIQIARIFFVLSTICLAVTVFKIRHVKDAYYLRYDIMVSAVCFLLASVGGILLNVGVYRVVMSVTLNVNLFVVVTVKVILSYRSAVSRLQDMRKQRKLARRGSQAGSQSSSTESSSIRTLKDVMDDPEMLAQFNMHLRSEFSVENMLFYKRAKMFSVRCVDDVSHPIGDRNTEAAMIYADYIALDGELQVNIRDSIFNEIHTEIHSALRNFSVDEFRATRQVDSVRPVSADIFENAAQSIYQLMSTDTLVRFKMKIIQEEERLSSDRLGLKQRPWYKRCVGRCGCGCLCPPARSKSPAFDSSASSTTLSISRRGSISRSRARELGRSRGISMTAMAALAAADKGGGDGRNTPFSTAPEAASA